MSDTPIPKVSDNDVQTIAIEAGVSDRDVRDIIAMIGTDRSSVIRETRLLAKRRMGPQS
ncbi:hypothetical protein ACSBOB_09030 [Mesorhizobium sp. ASY16-5R]|uniref:hypothetical protein n=1 Tax=Mesorhizobium sp. ASY16-5R TaxID=3445772 RepID=UPI003F9F8757